MQSVASWCVWRHGLVVVAFGPTGLRLVVESSLTLARKTETRPGKRQQGKMTTGLAVMELLQDVEEQYLTVLAIIAGCQAIPELDRPGAWAGRCFCAVKNLVWRH
ncbi:hypothetical protein ElyMa_005121700 [Elysia marginata]|uniref:Secreted protein n=1 Tax=Elysia marginata TaxID=1093978 RepID=A0AAV4JN35_9GAST|nr:hypothetical protein ElyMa_005121700 [Elysia marginata]